MGLPKTLWRKDRQEKPDVVSSPIRLYRPAPEQTFAFYQGYGPKPSKASQLLVPDTDRNHEHDDAQKNDEAHHKERADSHRYWTASMRTPFALERRSEERRVGKECRSRCSPYH